MLVLSCLEIAAGEQPKKGAGEEGSQQKGQSKLGGRAGGGGEGSWITKLKQMREGGWNGVYSVLAFLFSSVDLKLFFNSFSSQLIS